MTYDPVETDARTDIRDLQAQRLRETVTNAYENVPFYREKLDEAGVEPADIESVADVTLLPQTTKEDFRVEYPRGLFATDMEAVVRIHASSGTTGKPKIVPYTDSDLAVWREVMARSLAAAGVASGATVQNAYGYGLFTGGHGLEHGAEELGATHVHPPTRCTSRRSPKRWVTIRVTCQSRPSSSVPNPARTRCARRSNTAWT